MDLKHFQTKTPVCPYCDHVMTIDETTCSSVFIFDITTREESLDRPITCPACDNEFWVKGGYDPHYTTGLTEEDIEEV